MHIVDVWNVFTYANDIRKERKVSRKMNVAFYLTPKSNVVYLFGDYTLKQGLERMRTGGYTAVPVIDREGKYIGTITEGDILWFMYDFYRNGNTELKEMSTQVVVSDVMNKRYDPVHVDVSENQLFLGAMAQNFVPVIDDRQSFIGIVTRKTILSMMNK